MRRARNELSMLKRLDHPHICNIFEVYEDARLLYMVQELLNGGELSQYIAARRKLRESEAAGVMLQVLRAINYCHRMRIVHRDLKPENILVEGRHKTNLDHTERGKIDK